jgi:hypothetical protein
VLAFRLVDARIVRRSVLQCATWARRATLQPPLSHRDTDLHRLLVMRPEPKLLDMMLHEFFDCNYGADGDKMFAPHAGKRRRSEQASGTAI